MSVLQFSVTGRPAPQGSKTANAGGRGFRESSKALKPWRKQVHFAAKAALPAGWVALEGPLLLEVTFFLHRPQRLPVVRMGLPIATPDLSKLVRAVEDSCTTAGVWGDDAQVTTTVSKKRYVRGREGVLEPGAHVSISRDPAALNP